jgi:hypothetical protein
MILKKLLSKKRTVLYKNKTDHLCNPLQNATSINHSKKLFKFYKKNTLEFHSLIFCIFEALFKLFPLFFFENSPLLTSKEL